MIGGIEAHCERLYPDLVRLAPNLCICLLTRLNYTPRRRFDFHGVEVRALWAPTGVAIEAAIHTLIAIAYARFVYKAKLVHLHGIGPAFFAPLARLLGMRILVTHHAADFERPKWGRFARAFLKAGEAIAARTADGIICVSDALRAEFLARHPRASKRTRTIRHGAAPMPIDADAERRVLVELGLEAGAYNLAVGRLDATKRFHDLIAAMDKVNAETAPLVIVGSAIEDTDYARGLLAQAGPKLKFAGYRHNGELGALYRQAALFIHPSEMEGFGLVVLEALTADIPIKLSDIPAHREFGLPDGCYFPIGDQDRIAEILSSPDHHRKTAAFDSAAIKARYSVETSAADHVALYQSFDASRV